MIKDEKDICSVTGRVGGLQCRFIGNRRTTAYVTGTSTQDFRRKPVTVYTFNWSKTVSAEGDKTAPHHSLFVSNQSNVIQG